MRAHRVLCAVLAVGLVAACGDNATSLDSDRVARGGQLYQQHCASCHRTDLSGDPNWRTPDEDGFYRPPPHDSSGHTWHHPDRVLMEIIKGGSPLPKSRMPGFGDKLSDDDIGAIIEFFKDNWGPQERAYQEQVTEQERDQ